MQNSEKSGDTQELRDRKIRRQEKSIVEQREKRRYSRTKRQEDQKTGEEYCRTAREGDTPELRDRKIRRQEKSNVEQREKWRCSRAERQEDQKTVEEYCRTAREEEILQS